MTSLGDHVVTYYVTCNSCRDDNDQPREWREHCPDCAEDLASTHRALGHDATVESPSPKRSLRRSSATKRLTGERA